VSDKDLMIAAIEAKTEEERDQHIATLVSGMTLGEKIRQMSGNTDLARQAVMLVRYNKYPYESGENRRRGIPAIRFTDGPRGISLNNSTCFPVPMARGATWDVELEERVGCAMGIEARSQGANYYGGVCINALRHPAMGRAQETYGEDPCHLGAMAVGEITGLQKHVMACAKHFACNSIEESRFYVDVKIAERTLREIYLPHFKKCVDAGVASFMSAYNKVNGEYCGHNRHLLTDILKKDWGFKGFVISDFLFGIRDGKAAANAGLDIEMPITLRFGKKLKQLVINGGVPMQAIDESVTRILRQKAIFSKRGVPIEYGPLKVACREHTELAREVAQKGIVLLKNENGALPLERTIKTIAVFGKLADRANLGDMGSSRVRPPYAVTPLQGIKKRAGNSINVAYYEGTDLEEIRRLAKEADAAIVIAGSSWRQEGEYIPLVPPFIVIGGDRKDLDIPRDQAELIKTVAAENKRCIVVLVAGAAITMESWKERPQAILMAWYPGMEGGNAIADILFGEVNPSGKLPIVFPKSNDQLPHFDNKARSIEYGYYHGYRLFDKKGLEPAFPFGFGLSYTKFDYANLKLDKKEIGTNGRIRIEAKVTNVGRMRGDEIAQLYIGFKGSKIERPVKDLKGFRRLSLEPGETKSISFEVKAEDIAWYNPDAGRWEIEEIEYEVYVGSSSRPEDFHLSGAFRVSGS